MRKVGRRLFLTGAGGAMLALPWLPSLLPRALRRTAAAQDPVVPKRFVAFKTYNGTPVLDFYPRNAPPGYDTHSVDGTVALSTPVAQATGRHSNGMEYFARTAPLSDFAGRGLSNVFGTALDAHLDSMILYRGLDLMPNLNHNHGGMLGNFGLRTAGVGGVLPGAQINVTIDHVMAASDAVYGPGATPSQRVFHVGSRRDTCSYAPADASNLLATGESAIVQAQAIVNPQVAFNTVFAGFSAEPGETEPAVSSRLIDRVIEDYRRAQSSPHLGRADRQTLQRHIDHLAELEGRLVSGGPSCDPGSAPASLDTAGEFDVDVGQIEQLWENMIDVVVLALSCDVTRVVTIDVTKMVIDDGGDVFGMGDSQNPDSAGRSNWHLQAHNWDANAIRWLGQGARWVAQNPIKRLLDQLSEPELAQEDDRSLLYHSLVMWGNELSFNHLNYSLPTATWGHAGGYLRPGQYVDYIDHDRPIRFRQHDGSVIEGVQYNRFLVTLMQAMGLSPSDYEREAGRGFGETRPIEKDGGFALDYDDSNVGAVLPGIVAS